MLSIFNNLTNYKGYVAEKYEKIFEKDSQSLKGICFHIRPRKNSRGVCPHCGRQCATYDTSKQPRFFDFPPMWNLPVQLSYRMRRVQCPEHGVVTEQIPWAEGKETQTKVQVHFLSTWARRLDWSSVASCFFTTYGKVFRAVQQVVQYGLEHRSLEGVESIGIDEIQYKKGHQYMTLIYQLDEEDKRLLWVGKDRTEETVKEFFKTFNAGTSGEKLRSNKLKWVCSDMWKPYLNQIRKCCHQALNILDRFHIKKHLNEAVDQTRKNEVKRLRESGKEAILTGSKWLLLKNSDNLTKKQVPEMSELLSYNLRTVRAYLHKETFDRFWSYKSKYWAERYLKQWITKVLRSRIEPMKKFAKTLRSHQQLLLNWFASDRLSSGTVEGFNNKVKLTMRKSYGFGSEDTLKIALYHVLGQLPEPEVTH